MCVFKLWAGAILGHDVWVTILCVLRVYSFMYSTVKYIDKVLLKVGTGLAKLENVKYKRAYAFALVAARFCLWPSFFAGVSDA